MVWVSSKVIFVLSIFLFQNTLAVTQGRTCADITCPDGSVCRQDTIACVTDPCPQPEPECVVQVAGKPEVSIQETPKDVCSEPKVVGVCRMSIPRFYFNAEANACESFKYGGCGENGNNFLTLQDCQNACPGSPAVAVQQIQEREATSCKEMECPAGTQCQQETMVCITSPCPQPKPQCVAVPANGGEAGTPGSAQDVCREPKVVGHCKGSHTRYFFNSESNSCEEFTYGGCGGNGNNFGSLQQCQSACPVSSEEVTQQSQEVNPLCPVPRQVFRVCGSPCPPTCSNLNPVCMMACSTGCECPRSAPVLHEGRCIAAEECPQTGAKPSTLAFLFRCFNRQFYTDPVTGRITC
ncbi:WAP four-disulfide core domain protein 8-like [Lingula anatina]|uniref:WAP four-disulfide core domain protein 8-like n=1 Tax=Lingula anatina TaxID=7574 RepID=A0A1S3HXF0_LINAN|nr:WAP four-disulfide core domain protein 8-like [Lingula anatina]|eukprot:XP_013390688.1 WAP four-disulfide core domain protein 8-like [Lingula anatina]